MPMQETQETGWRQEGIRSLGQEDPLKEEMTIRSNILTWKISWTEESDGESMGLQSQTRLSTHTCMHIYTASTH